MHMRHRLFAPSTRTVSERVLWRLVIVGIVLFALLQVTHAFTPSTARAFTCGNQGIGNGHCYAYNDWPGVIEAAYTHVNVTGLTCNSCIDRNGNQTGFIDVEQWLIDKGNSGCSNSNNQCWIEGGYITRSNSSGTTTDYFWGENRPGIGYTIGYTNDIGGTGSTAEINLFLTGALSDHSWTIEVYTPAAGEMVYVNSYSNSMVADDINIGQELAGTGTSAHSPEAHFTLNQWVKNGVGHYQYLDGTLHYNNPPYIAYTIKPSASGSNGGNIKVWCC